MTPAAWRFDLADRPLICPQVFRVGGLHVSDRVCLQSARRRHLLAHARQAGFLFGIVLAFALFAVQKAAGW